MDLSRAITKAYRTAKERNWDTIYILVDAHDTICGSNYKDAEAEFYPQALHALREICKLPEVHLVLWTSCYPEEGPKYVRRLAGEGVFIKGLNETPVENTTTGDFRKKPYFSILIDDKAGFVPEEWSLVYSTIAQCRVEYPLRPK
jgi:deoxyribodipyrimidine photolyase